MSYIYIYVVEKIKKIKAFKEMKIAPCAHRWNWNETQNWVLNVFFIMRE